MTDYKQYTTPSGLIAGIERGGIGAEDLWKASSNDFSDNHSESFYHIHLSDLDWKDKPEAQADLDAVAKKLGLKEDKRSR